MQAEGNHDHKINILHIYGAELVAEKRIIDQLLTDVTVLSNVFILTAIQTDPINMITYSIVHTIPIAEVSAPTTIVSRSAYFLNIHERKKNNLKIY